MAGFFKRKPMDWRDDDYVFLEDLKKKPQNKIDEIITENSKDERAVKRPVHESLVKHRLEQLQNTLSNAPKPLNDKFFNENVVEDKVVDNTLLKDIERSIKKIDNIKQKIGKTNSFLSLFYDLKKAEKEFLSKVEQAESEMLDIPEHLASKIKEVKSNIRTV